MKFKKYFDSFGKKLSHATELICIPMVVIMITIVLANVFFRYVLRSGIPWAEEVTKYVMIWMVMLGSSIVFHNEGHVSIDFLIKKLKYKQLISIFHDFLTLAFLCILIYSGFKYAYFGKKLISPTLRISRYWAFMSIPIGGVLMFIQSLVVLNRHTYSTSYKKVKNDGQTTNR